MISNLKSLLFGTRPFQVKSDFDIKDSVLRLNDAVSSFSVSTLFKEKLVGHVRENHVVLRRERPHIQNSFKPFLDASFIEEDGCVYLKGEYRMSRPTQIFMVFWFGFIAFWELMVISKLQLDNPKYYLFILAGLVMLGFGVLLIKFGAKLASNDISWINSKVTKALKNGA